MLQFTEFFSIVILWIVSVVLFVKKKCRWLLISLFGLHFSETVLIGLKTGLEYGKKAVYSIIMSMAFGFTWWLPLYRQIKREKFTDEDFLRKPDDNPVLRRK